MAEQRQYLKYTFFKVLPEWRKLDDNTKSRGKGEFLRILDNFSRRIALKTYSLVGIRGDSDFLLWTLTYRLEDLQELVSELFSTALGKYLQIPYSYLAMTKKSEYLAGHAHVGQEGAQLEREPGHARYLFVYPFTKKREWYKIPFEERRRMMGEHFRIGHKYPSVKINTAYSFGLDDQEFMLSFETDDPAHFLDLVEELRSSDASQYTLLETPIFTCISVEPARMLDLLG